MIRSRTVALPVVDRYRAVTDGGLFAGARQYFELECPEFTSLLPYAESVTLLSLTEKATTNFTWNLYFNSGYNRANELTTGPFAIGTDIAGPQTNPSKRHSPYTALTTFLLESRLLLGIGNGTGSATESALLSVTLLVQTVGM